ncbi:nitrogen regulation protein NR(II) [Neorhodopirellula lusitana]|uniref:transcriptional regulator n=1 Tax=Neorhodopirellula lusitana TaxID=445327 RepID=UPI0024B78BF0|nr:transcriptional regulator [Neorhodopirellula lusitana]
MTEVQTQADQTIRVSLSPFSESETGDSLGMSEAEGVVQLQVDFRTVTQWLNDHDRQSSSFGQNIGQELDNLRLSTAVCLTDSDGMIRGINKAARVWLGIDQSSIGGRSNLLPWHRGNRLEDLSDQMLTMGARQLQFIHEAQTPQGRWWRWATIRSHVPAIIGGGEDSIVMTRPVAKARSPQDQQATLLTEQLALFYELDETDRAICHGIALGDSTSEVAQSVGLTRRSVEVRRTKILEHFGFARIVQVVRLMVRFEENQLLNG